MIGKRLLVGVSYLAPGGGIQDQLQFAGQVLAVDPLVCIDQGEGMEPFTLPPVEEAFDPAPPGEYRLRSTGQVVVDPGFITSWTVQRPETDAP